MTYKTILCAIALKNSNGWYVLKSAVMAIIRRVPITRYSSGGQIFDDGITMST